MNEMFRRLWFVMLVGAYAGWTIWVFASRRDYGNWRLWFEDEGGVWLIINLSGIFFASLMYWVSSMR